MATDPTELSKYGFSADSVAKLTEAFGSKVKFTNAAGAILDIAAPHIAAGKLALAKTTPDNYDRIKNDTHEKVTGTHEKGAKTVDDLVKKPEDDMHFGPGAFIKGLSEADLLKLHEKAQDILKDKSITLIKR